MLKFGFHKKDNLFDLCSFIHKLIMLRFSLWHDLLYAAKLHRKAWCLKKRLRSSWPGKALNSLRSLTSIYVPKVMYLCLHYPTYSMQMSLGRELLQERLKFFFLQKLLQLPIMFRLTYLRKFTWRIHVSTEIYGKDFWKILPFWSIYLSKCQYTVSSKINEMPQSSLRVLVVCVNL